MINVFLLILALLILCCLMLTKISGKLGIPVLLGFLVLGMICGSDGLLKIQFDDYSFAERACSFALIIIMFYGGFGTNWKTARPIVGKSVLLSTLGVVLTAAFTGFFCYWVLHISFWESMLIGSVLGSTDAASVFSILRSRRINLRDGTAPILEVESGSNDPVAYLLTTVVLSVMHGGMTGVELLGMLFCQVVFGVAVGVLTALIFGWLQQRMANDNNGFDTILVFAAAILSYAGAACLNGNGYLSAYLAGMILGNRPLPNKKPLVHFFDGMTSLMQMLLFFLLGLLSYPSQFAQVALPALCIALFLTVVARPAAVFLLLKPFGCSVRQCLLIAWAGIRGAASIVFAIMATVHPAYLKHDVFHIVFFVVLFSISLQGSLIPWMAKKLSMIDDHSNVLKTFSDYSEELALQFVQIQIGEQHPWIHQLVHQLQLPPGLLVVLVLRGKEHLVPDGHTQLHGGDIVVLSAFSIEERMDQFLTEMVLDTDHDWIGKSLQQLQLGRKTLIVAIKRGEEVLIPNGQTVLRQDDVLICHKR